MAAVGLTTGAGIREEARRADRSAQERWRRSTRLSQAVMVAEQNRLLAAAVGTAGRLLEVGAGVGTFLADASADSRFGRVCAVEVSHQSAKLALAAAGGRAPVLLAPAENLPFRDESFDAVVARGVVHHLSDPSAAVREMHRILRPQGRLVIFEGNPASSYRRAMLGLADLLRIPHEDTQYRHLRPEEISRLLSPFHASRAAPINGMFAPLSYMGIGGPRSWRALMAIRRAVIDAWPSGFAWWLLWIAEK